MPRGNKNMGTDMEVAGVDHRRGLSTTVDWSGITAVWVCNKCGYSGLELEPKKAHRAGAIHSYTVHILPDRRDRDRSKANELSS